MSKNTNTKSIESDFLTAKAKTTVVVMNAMGWQQGVVNPDSLGGDYIFFYVFDYQTSWIWCCSILRHDFYAMIEKSKSIDRNDLVVVCEQMITECAAKNAVDPEMENNLAIALTAYISHTKTYQLTDNAKKSNHFVVIRYGATSTIRPFAMGGPPGNLISSEVIQDSIKNVIVIDSRNHPEWIS